MLINLSRLYIIFNFMIVGFITESESKSEPAVAISILKTRDI